MNNSAKKTTARVVTAMKLKENQLSALSDILSRKLNKEVEISEHIDQTLIGGFYIQVDGLVIDRTVKRQINDMKNSIRKGGIG